MDLFEFINKHNLHVPVIIVARNGSVHDAVRATSRVAKDYLLISEDGLLLKRSIEKALKTNTILKNENAFSTSRTTLVSHAPAMIQLLQMAQRVSHSTATVLIQGESGAGKELLARYIHEQSDRRNHCFVAMNCAALPGNLAESELFGYERGASTGAVQRRAGKFEQAQGCTLLLEEISEIDLALQAKLLRVLQEKEVDRVGGQRPVAVDVRVIATTNRDLGQMVNEGLFRKDLYYRLRIVPLRLPSLRDRLEEIPVLANHFITKHWPENETSTPAFDNSALGLLKQWPWPGNIRELENAVERALLLQLGPTMGPELLILDDADNRYCVASAEDAQLVGMTVKELEERLIVQTLAHFNENRTHAAEMLDISIRTLRNKLREYKNPNGETAKAAHGG